MITIGKTSSAAKNRWNRDNYKRYTINLRKDEDKELIEYVEKNKEKIGVTEIFRIGIETLKK